MVRFSQVDVFTDALLSGNPVAVVHDATHLDDETMAAFARWTNLSETTFLLPASDDRADYRLRIFTPGGELPFAGHPTLGSARAWLEAGNTPRTPARLVQECLIGLVAVRRDDGRLAFAAPPLRRSGPVDGDLQARVLHALGLAAASVREVQWVDNGPGWVGVLLASADDVLGVEPDASALGDLAVGVMGPYAQTRRTPGDPAFEARAFVPSLGVLEDPVTGSLAAGFASWLVPAGLAPEHYVVRQGTRVRRSGILHIDVLDGQIWVGGNTVVGVIGELTLG